MNLRYIFFILICLSNGCREVFVPKPRAFLSLEYPKATYQKINSNMPFSFEKNKLAVYYCHCHMLHLLDEIQ